MIEIVGQYYGDGTITKFQELGGEVVSIHNLFNINKFTSDKILIEHVSKEDYKIIKDFKNNNPTKKIYILKSSY